MIDSGKIEANSNQLQDLSAEKDSLEQSIPAVQTQSKCAPPAKPALTSEDTITLDSLTNDSKTPANAVHN